MSMAGLLQDTEVDEYGIEKPKKNWLELGTDLVAPEADDPWYEQLGKGLAAAPLGIGGALLDELPIVGGAVGGPLNGMQEGGETAEYYRQRAEAEARAAEEAPLGPRVDPTDLPDGGECGPFDGMYD